MANDISNRLGVANFAITIITLCILLASFLISQTQSQSEPVGWMDVLIYIVIWCYVIFTPILAILVFKKSDRSASVYKFNFLVVVI